MAKFGSSSLKQRETLHPRLKRVLDEAIKYYDFTIIEGFRGRAAQEKAFAAGKSKLPWPKGNHNSFPSKAADLAPFPVDWSDRSQALVRFGILAGVIKACADRLKVKIRWGADWNRNWDPRDETFLDWGHFELDEG